MTAKQFLEELQDVLQRDDAITLDTILKDMEEWDSLAIMAIITYFDKKFSIKITFETFVPLHTIADLVVLAKGAVK